MCSKEAIPTIYQITNKRPRVEFFEVTPKSSPETVVLCRTATEVEEQRPRKILGTCFSGKYPAFVEIMDRKRKLNFEELKESEKTYNEHDIVLDSYDGEQIVNNTKKKSTLFILAHRYLLKEAFVIFDQLQLVTAF